MKKNYKLRARLLFFLLSLIGTGASAQYCTTGLYSSGCGSFGDYIQSFSTTGGITNITNNGSNCAVASGYSDYTSMVYTGTGGSIANFSFTNTASDFEAYKIYVDWNQNNVFTDPGELMYSSATTLAPSTVVSSNFTIPVAALTGTTRMRVRCVYGSTTFTPCGSATWGEVEDYGFIVQSAVPCAGTPAGGTTTSSANPICSGINFNLTLPGSTTGVSGLTYQWQSSPDGITYSNIAGATGTSYSTNQTAGTYYQCIVTCSLSGLSSTSTPVNETMNPFLNCYCSSNATTTADEEIFNVTVGTLNNTSTCATTGGAGSILNEYSNYTVTVPAPTVTLGSVVPFSVQVGTCGGNYGSGTAIFIDYNHNGSFADAGEQAYSTPTTTTGPHVVASNFTVPLGALTGNTRMRVINAEGYSGAGILPCLIFGYGETEDYFINIVPLPPTPPTPTQSAVIPACSTGTDLSVAGSPAVGDAWYWQTSATGTSTSTPVSGPYTVFVNGTFYVRTYNATYGVWSLASSSITVTNIPLAPLPPSPTAISPSCLSTSISVAAATGTTTYYWQGTTSGGTSSAVNASSPFTATASGTYYVAAYDASTSCWSNTNGLAVVIDTYVPATPTTTTSSLGICLGAPSGIITASAPSSGTLTASFGTSLSSPGTPTAFNITVPALPLGATITGTQLEIIGATALGGSYRSEIRVALAGSTTLAATQISVLTSAGLITPDPSVTVPNLPLAGGPVTLTLTETFDDAGTDATFTEIRLVISYTVSSSTITWWNAASAGTLVGSGSPLETVGTTLLPTTTVPGTYTFYAQATAGSCTSSPRLAIPVTVNPLPVVTAPAPSTVCSGSMVTLNGGGAATYVWDNGVTNGVAFTSSSTTTYNVVGTDGNGCTNTSSTIVTVNPLPAITAMSTPILCNGGTSTVTISASGGTPAYTGEGSFTQLAGTVVYTVMDANSCAGTASVVVTQPTVLAATSTVTAVLCNGGTGSADVTATGGTPGYAYAWTPSGGSASTATGLLAGSYTCTITDANFCSTTASVIVTEPTVLALSSTQTSVSCNGGSNGSANITAVGGTPGYAYAWTPSGGSAAIATGLTAGTYICTVTDANGCTAPISVTILQPAVLAASFTSAGISCNGDSATVVISATGGTGPYTGTGSFHQGPGTIIYTVTDANSCSTTVSVNEIEPAVLSLGSGGTSIMCHGGSSTITISAIGGTPAYIGTGSFTQLAGTTTYVVTDAHGCVASTNITVTEPTAIVPVVVSSTAILCNGGTSTVTISATGGTGTLTGTGSFTQSAGTIVYTVSDANGCSATVSNSVTQPTAIMVMSSFTSILCNGGTSAVTISAMDGTPPYVAGGEGTFTQSAGTIVYTVTDANSCTGTASVTITEPAAITASQTANICSGQSVTVGTSTYTTAGTFTDILPAFNSCDSTVTTTVVVNALPIVTATSTSSAICAGGSVTLTGGGATTYAWDHSVTDAVAFTPSATATYIVTGTDVNSCTNTASTTVTVNPLPTVTLAPFTSPVCFQGAPITLTGGSPTGGVYSGTGVTAGVFSPSVAGVGSFAITYIVTDVNTCSNTSSTNITVQDCTGIDENVASQEVSVYPNPTSGIFNIAISNANFNELVISIVDIQGKQVFYSSEKNVSGAYSKQINLEELSKGLYYIKVSTDSEVKVQKLIIQ